jgi:uncharacterized protein YbjT (DUF2867 family)
MKVLVFGATGSAGGSVLNACLSASSVSKVRAIVRRPLAVSHAKLRTIVHADFEDYSAIADVFADLDACLFCLGKSATQVSNEAEYRRITRDLAIAAARAVQTGSPDAIFHFVSGAGADLQSPFMWARVKAETERELIAQVNAVCWRPAAIDGLPSQSEPRLYRVLRPFLRLMSPFRTLYVKGEDIGFAMLQATAEQWRGRTVENAEIRDLADRARQLERLAALQDSPSR